MPISHDEAQELHGAIGMALEGVGDWRAALDDALAIASVVASDTDPDRWESRDDGQAVSVTSDGNPRKGAVFTRLPGGSVEVFAVGEAAGSEVTVFLTAKDWDAVVNQME